MQSEAGLVVFGVFVLVLVAHEVYLARSLAQTRGRLLSLERFVRVLDLEAKRRAADLERLAAVEQAPAPTPTPAPAATQAVGVTEPDDDDACTQVWIGAPAALVEAAARGANPPSEATPRAAPSMDVAPRAAALPSPLSSAAPQVPAPVVAIARFPPTLLSMQAQSAPTHELPTRREAVEVPARRHDDDGEATTVLDAEPPRYAPRAVALRPPAPLAPLAHPDLIGSEDIADEAAPLRLGPEDETPPRIGRASPRLPIYADEKVGGPS